MVSALVCQSKYEGSIPSILTADVSFVRFPYSLPRS